MSKWMEAAQYALLKVIEQPAVGEAMMNLASTYALLGILEHLESSRSLDFDAYDDSSAPRD
ncbi:hypothetical protein AN916_08225 [Mycobacteroides immunogenum]|nr:hypothetical protein AN916_07710 [Mycobacteroides immunogenum]KPG55815.1 hypothetical protein AN916_08225 [Mycobacteroides immunogenum]